MARSRKESWHRGISDLLHWRQSVNFQRCSICSVSNEVRLPDLNAKSNSLSQMWKIEDFKQPKCSSKIQSSRLTSDPEYECEESSKSFSYSSSEEPQISPSKRDYFIAARDAHGIYIDSNTSVSFASLLRPEFHIFLNSGLFLIIYYTVHSGKHRFLTRRASFQKLLAEFTLSSSQPSRIVRFFSLKFSFLKKL